MSGSDEHDSYDRGKVSRLPALPMPPDPISLKMFDEQKARGGHILNMHLVNAHAPALAQAKRGVTYALRNLCKASRQMRELAILRTAILVDQQYEINHHIPMALKTGITEEQIAALRGDWKPKASLFTAQQSALLDYVDCLCLKRGEVPDSVFGELSRHFSPQEILELTHTSTNYWATGVFIRAMQIELDPPTRTTAPGSY